MDGADAVQRRRASPARPATEVGYPHDPDSSCDRERPAPVVWLLHDGRLRIDFPHCAYRPDAGRCDEPVFRQRQSDATLRLRDHTETVRLLIYCSLVWAV